MPTNSKGLIELDAILDRERLSLVRVLLDHKALYLTEIANISKTDRATSAYHLGVLEKAGIVSSEYRLLREAKFKGKAARFYSLNHDKLDQALREIAKIIPSKFLALHE